MSTPQVDQAKQDASDSTALLSNINANVLNIASVRAAFQDAGGTIAGGTMDGVGMTASAPSASAALRPRCA